MSDRWRFGIALLELALFLDFWLMAETSNQLWLTAAAGFQLILVLSFIVVLIIPDTYVWSGVMARYAAWCRCWRDKRAATQDRGRTSRRDLPGPELGRKPG